MMITPNSRTVAAQVITWARPFFPQRDDQEVLTSSTGLPAATQFPPIPQSPAAGKAYPLCCTKSHHPNSGT